MSEIPPQYMVDALASTEAGRRVGWAKYYDESSAKDRQEALAAHRMGLLVGFAEHALRTRMTKRQMSEAIVNFVDQFLVDPFPRHSFEQGKKDFDEFRRLRWRSISAMVRALAPKSKFDGVTQCRCQGCQKLLAEVEDGVLTIRCQRCKSESRWRIT